MASSAVSVLRELSHLFLECEICRSNFKEPRELDCKHTYCLQCLHFLFEDQPMGTSTVTCPSCKKLTTIPEGGVGNLSKNRILDTLLDKITSDTEKLLRNSCSSHEGRELELFCKKCELPICHVCAVDSHPKPEHEYAPLSSVVNDYREVCSGYLKDIADEVVRDEKNLKTARRKSAILRERKDEVESKVHAAAEDMMQLIKIREQELGEELDCILETREQEIDIFSKALEKKLRDNRKMIDELRDVLDRGEDTEIVKKYGELRQIKVHKIPQAPEGLRFVSFKRDEDAATKENLGTLKEIMIPWNDNQEEEGIDVLNSNHHEGNKVKKEKSEKEASEKGDKEASKNKEGNKSGKEGNQGNKGKNGSCKKHEKVHPSMLPPTPPASPRTSGVFSIGPNSVYLKGQPQGHGGGGGSKQTLTPTSDIFGNHHQRSHKDSSRKGIRIVDPNSNQDITELIMGDKNRSPKVKKRGQPQSTEG